MLIYGDSGTSGIIAIQLAKVLGAKVTGVCSTTNLEFVKSLGADVVIDYTKVNSLASGATYDFILGTVGKRKTSKLKDACRKALAPGGKYVSIDDGNLLLDSNRLDFIKEHIEAGRIKPIFDKCYSFEDIVEAHRYVERGHKKRWSSDKSTIKIQRTLAVSIKKHTINKMILPPYDKFPSISDDKISLREIQFSDISDLIEISFYDAIQATTLQQATEMQIKINQDYIDGNSIHWGIANKLTNEIIGTCGYYRGLDKGEGELGCVLLPRYRGQGYMTPAMVLAIEFGLNNIGLKRIWAITTKQNEKAIKLIENLNFIKIADLDDNEIEYELRQNVY